MGLRQLFEYHPLFGYRFVPELSTRVAHEGGGYQIRANREGFRCAREVEAERPADRQRVLVFGDSFVAGDGVANEHRFSDLIERQLEGAEVMNFGLPASGTDQQFLTWQYYAPRIEHDLVMVVIYLENIRRLGPDYVPQLADGTGLCVYLKPRFELSGGALVPPTPPVPRISTAEALLDPEEAQTLRWLKAQRAARSPAEAFPEYASSQTPPWALMRAILEAWNHASRTPLILVTVPPVGCLDLADQWAHHARFQELTEATNITWIDLVAPLRAQAPSQQRKLRFETDVHLTRTGHGVVADILTPVVAEALGKL